MDMLIAAHARSIKAVLVTNDLRHFTKVPGLKVEDWS
jgi:tRNA(fMet)-specific endonuclease VapC